MRTLLQTHPKVYDQFMIGNSTIGHKQAKMNGVWRDVNPEQTYNKEEKATFSEGETQNNFA